MGLGQDMIYRNTVCWSSEDCSVFRRTISLLELFHGLTYGALQSKLAGAGDVCKGLEDVVGSVRGFLTANK